MLQYIVISSKSICLIMRVFGVEGSLERAQLLLGNTHDNSLIIRINSCYLSQSLNCSALSVSLLRSGLSGRSWDEALTDIRLFHLRKFH